MCVLYPTTNPELGMTALINNYAKYFFFIMADKGLLSPPNVHQKGEPKCSFLQPSHYLRRRENNKYIPNDCKMFL